MDNQEQPKKKVNWRTVLIIFFVLWVVGTCMEKKQKPKSDAEFYEEYLRSHPDVWNDMQYRLTH